MCLCSAENVPECDIVNLMLFLTIEDLEHCLLLIDAQLEVTPIQVCTKLMMRQKSIPNAHWESRMGRTHINHFTKIPTLIVIQVQLVCNHVTKAFHVSEILILTGESTCHR